MLTHTWMHLVLSLAANEEGAGTECCQGEYVEVGERGGGLFAMTLSLCPE